VRAILSGSESLKAIGAEAYRLTDLMPEGQLPGGGLRFEAAMAFSALHQ
jgi:hypothetical protein